MKSAPIFAAIMLAISSWLVAEARAVETVPAGNRNAEQPPIPGGSYKRSRGTTFDRKYARIYKLLSRNRKLLKKIRKAARTFDIEPVHIVGALVGEHTYNVDAQDRLQSYYVKALAYLKQDLKFAHKGTSIEELVDQPAFSRCGQFTSSYDLWSCREAVWNTRYRGKTIAGRRWPNDRLGRVFFQPFFAGQTFGLGQLNPLTALKVNDLVRARLPREPRLTTKRAPQIYNTIMEPDSTLYYMAAVLRHSIDSYARIADYDISGNPGVTATLYNLGNVTRRASELRAKNARRRNAGQKPVLPQENYYGWLVNEKESELRSLF